jgi:hypothetical protein
MESGELRFSIAWVIALAVRCCAAGDGVLPSLGCDIV